MWSAQASGSRQQLGQLASWNPGLGRFRLVPFLVELRAVMDWVWTDTTLSLSSWMCVEDIYANIFIIKCSRETEKVLDSPWVPEAKKATVGQRKELSETPLGSWTWALRVERTVAWALGLAAELWGAQPGGGGGGGQADTGWQLLLCTAQWSNIDKTLHPLLPSLSILVYLLSL